MTDGEKSKDKKKTVVMAKSVKMADTTKSVINKNDKVEPKEAEKKFSADKRAKMLPTTKEEWYDLYEEETGQPATYPRGGKEWPTKAFIKWKKEKILFVESGEEIKPGILVYNIANDLYEKYLFKSIRETKFLRIWIDGTFKDWIYTDSIIESYINEYGEKIDTKIPKSDKELIKSIIKGKCWTDLEEWEKDNYKSNILNGILTYNEDEYKWTFKKHSEGNIIYSLIQFPVKYDPDAKCPIINKFLIDTIGKEQTEIMYRMIGYMLLPTIKFDKSFIMTGQEDTGETTTMNLLRAFIGDNNISALDLYRLGANFQIHNTADKVANIIDDVPVILLSSATCGRMKQLASNKRIAGEIKNVQGHHTWNNRCKNLAAYNRLPDTEDDSDPFYKRIVGFEFLNQIPKDKQTKDYYRKLISEEEFSGLLNMALKAYIRLEKDKKFGNIWDSPIKSREWWKNFMNPLDIFVRTHCETGLQRFKVDYKELQDLINEQRVAMGLHKYKPIYITQQLKKIHKKITTKPVNKKAHPESCGKDYIYITLKSKRVYIPAERLKKKAKKESEKTDKGIPDLKEDELEF